MDSVHHVWLDAHHAQDQQLAPHVHQDTIGICPHQPPTSQHLEQQAQDHAQHVSQDVQLVHHHQPVLLVSHIITSQQQQQDKQWYYININVGMQYM